MEEIKDEIVGIPKRSRFSEAPWIPEEDTYIIVGGAGGISSWTTLLLSRAGFKPIVYDFDILEEHNLAGQLLPKKSIGETKVSALQGVVKDFADEELMVFNEKYTEGSPTNKYCIAGFDNMEARKAMFNIWYEANKEDPEAFFIDGRLQAEQMQIFCVTPSTAEEYKKYLFDDSEVEEASCTFKQTSHFAAKIASQIVIYMTNHFANVQQKVKIRKIPFYYEYYGPLDRESNNPD